MRATAWDAKGGDARPGRCRALKLTAGTEVNPKNPVPAVFQIGRYKQKVKPKKPKARHDLCGFKLSGWRAKLSSG
jgi:hypothetical protein